MPTLTPVEQGPVLTPVEPLPFSPDEVVNRNNRPLTFNEWMADKNKSGDGNIMDAVVGFVRGEVIPAAKGVGKMASAVLSPGQVSTGTTLRALPEGVARGATDTTSMVKTVSGAIGDELTLDSILKFATARGYSPEEMATKQETERKREYGRYVDDWHYQRGREGGVLREGAGAYIPDHIKKQVNPEVKQALYDTFAPEKLDPDVVKAGEYIDPLDLTIGAAATKAVTKGATKAKKFASATGNAIDRMNMEGVKDLLQPLSARVGKHSEEIESEVNRFLMRSMRRSQGAQEVLADFLHTAQGTTKEVAGKLSKKDQDKMFYHLANGDRLSVNKIFDRQNAQLRDALRSKLKEVDNVNAKFLDDARAAGMDVGEIPDYWARRMSEKSYKDFVKDKGIQLSDRKWERIFKDAEVEYGRPLDDYDKAAIINSEISRGKRQALPTASNVKQRQIEDLSYADYKKYYDPGDSAMAKYYDNMSTAIEKRNFFAGGLKKPARKQPTSVYMGSGVVDTIPGPRGKLPVDANGMVKQGAREFNLEESIGAYLQQLQGSGKIGYSQMDDLSGLLKDVFAGPSKTGKFSKAMSLMTYGTMMGQFDTAALQLTDLAIEASKSGPKAAVKGLVKQDMAKDLGLRSIGLEGLQMDIIDKSLREGIPAKAIDKLFKTTGLRQVDAIMKGMSARTGLSKWTHLRGKKLSDPAVQKFMDENTKWFGDDVVGLAEDLTKLPKKIADEDLTEDMRLLMFNNLSQHQPISYFQYPRAYLRNGNLRFAYALKSFMLKYVDNMNRITVREWKKGNKKQAIKNTIMLGSFMGASQTGFEAGREFVYDQVRALADGRYDDVGEFYRDRGEVWKDAAVDGLLNAVGMNKYLLDRGADDPITTAVNFAIGPAPKIAKTLVDTAGEAASDLTPMGDREAADYKAMKYVPLGGRALDRTYGSYRRYLDSGSKDPTLNPLGGTEGLGGGL